MKLKSLTFLAVLVFSGLFIAGCGIVSVLGTERETEKNIPAEYALQLQPEQKILVYVHQGQWLNPKYNARYYISTASERYLRAVMEIGAHQIISYDQLTEMRSESINFTFLSPIEVGKQLKADYVLFINLENHELSEIAESGLYTGSLQARATLYNINDGKAVWPIDEKAKLVRVGVDMQRAQPGQVVQNLSSALVHCTMRFLYDCNFKKFKIPEDRSGVNWENY